MHEDIGGSCQYICGRYVTRAIPRIRCCVGASFATGRRRSAGTASEQKAYKCTAPTVPTVCASFKVIRGAMDFREPLRPYLPLSIDDPTGCLCTRHTPCIAAGSF